MARITINGVSYDPLSPQLSAHAASAVESADAASSSYILVQTDEPLTRIQREALAAAGAAVLEYVPEKTYLCRYEPSDLGPVRALPFVEWANVYMQEFKVAPALAAAPATPPSGPQELTALAAATGASPAQTPRTVDIVLHENCDPETVRAQVAEAAGVAASSLKVSRRKIRVTVQPRRLQRIAAIDEVRHLEEVTGYKLSNNIARGILGLPAGAPPPSVGLQGLGQVIAVADTGFDKGDRLSPHPAFTGRVKKLYALGRPADPSDPHGHGTHVAGSVLGSGVSQSLGIQIEGTAPKAKLVLQSVLDAQGGLGGLPDDLADLFGPPYTTDKARVHTNSWGSTVGDGSYNSNSRELDTFVWEHRDCVICFSAGNEGTDSDADGQINPKSVTPPGTAKNCITIGASENRRPTISDTYGEWWPNDFPANPISTDKMANNPEGMVAFSGRGPTVDQRIKPDVVAPGTFILSTRSRATTDDGWALSGDPLYFFMGGTSMATPLVAGCVALLREYLIKKRQTPSPSAALVKALLINGAENMAGQYVPTESPGVPNNAEGFGRVNVAKCIGPFAAGAAPNFKDEATKLDTGGDEKVVVAVPAGKTLKVTLVWTDPSGEGLQNDLDLIVRGANGEERHGNVAASSTAFDRLNNVEQVTWAPTPPGQAEITVRAFRVALQPQNYALVWRVF